MNDETKHFVCECGYRDHAFAFRYDAEDATLYLLARLTRVYGFWGRVWTALRYVFAHDPCGFGDWAEVHVSRDDAREIRSMIDRFVAP